MNCLKMEKLIIKSLKVNIPDNAYHILGKEKCGYVLNQDEALVRENIFQRIKFAVETLRLDIPKDNDNRFSSQIASVIFQKYIDTEIF